jgi:anti-sigma B factor antagonist
MTQAKATMQVRQVKPTIAVVEIHGEITAAAENALMDAYTEASSAGAMAVILDFSHLQYMNSSGIGLLVTLLIRINRQKQRLMACGLSEHYQQIFELTRLNEAIGIYADEAEATAAAEK